MERVILLITDICLFVLLLLFIVQVENVLSCIIELLSFLVGPSETVCHRLVVLPRLSEQLHLEDLWETLSECLKELAGSPDHHAVLVLQPAVEAFFLVHAAEKETDLRPRESSQQQRESQLAHLHVSRDIHASAVKYYPVFINTIRSLLHTMTP